MCTKQRSKVDFVEAFVLEKFEEVGGRGIDVREEAVDGSDCGVFAANKGLHDRAAGTCDDCVVAGEDWKKCEHEIREGRGGRNVPIMSATLV